MKKTGAPRGAWGFTLDFQTQERCTTLKATITVLSFFTAIKTRVSVATDILFQIIYFTSVATDTLLRAAVKRHHSDRKEKLKLH